jgi:hypothetical protein
MFTIFEYFVIIDNPEFRIDYTGKTSVELIKRWSDWFG